MSEPVSFARERAPRPEQVPELARRAEALARPVDRTAADPGAPMIVFALGAQDFALEAVRVVEVTPVRSFSPLPGGAAPLAGISHWRGEIVTVCDLRSVLGVEQAGIQDLARMLVLDHPDGPVGLLTDRVRAVLPVAPDAIRPVTDVEGKLPALIRGVAPDGALVLDPGELIRAIGEVDHSTGGTS